MRRRWSLLYAALAATVLSLIPGSPAHADPEPEKTYKLIPYVISDPNLVDNPERISEEFRKNLNLDHLGITPATSDRPSTASRPGSRAADTASYVVDSSRFPGGSKPADVYDYATEAQCNDSAAAQNDAGWIKNRFSYCQIHTVYMPAVECGLLPPSCKVTGEFLAVNMLRGQGKVGGHINDPGKVRWADFHLDVDVVRATGPFAKPSSTMKAGIECDGDYRDPIVPVDQDYACFPGSNDSTERPIPQWSIDDTAYFDLLSDARAPAEANGEQIATGVFHIEYDFDLDWYLQFMDTESPEGGLRFDSAWYLSQAFAGQLGSVFDRAVPGISLNKEDPAIAGAALHIEQSRTDPAASQPPNPNKVLPGATAGDPMHRLPRAKSADHRTRADRNRTVSTNFCATVAMQADKPETGTWDCDEYPFASTYEGSAGSESTYQAQDRQANRPVQQPLNWSVKWVDRDQNQEAGRRGGRWYENDRLLDYDHFFVTITGNDHGNPDPDVDAAPTVSAGPDRTGDEGVPVALHGTARDDRGAPNVHWSYSAGDDVDAGATCTFADGNAAITTITCTDDGTFIVTLTADDGVNAAASDSATVTLRNVAPALGDTVLPNPAADTSVTAGSRALAANTVSPTQWPVYRADTTVELSVPFTDPGTNDTHTCTVTWDDGGTESVPARNNTCQLTHTFTAAGMYTIAVTVRDDDGATSRSGPGTMIVVYDPDAGTANIDGSTTTPAGALVSDPDAPGLTWIHHTSQYQTSTATTPVGQGKAWTDGTSFRLEPSTVEWLVLTTDGKVASRGTGTIDGRAGYTWVVYGWDACQNGRTDCIAIPADRARLVVFDTTTGTVVYDHSPDSDEFDVDRINPRDLTSGAVQVHRTPPR